MEILHRLYHGFYPYRNYILFQYSAGFLGIKKIFGIQFAIIKVYGELYADRSTTNNCRNQSI